MITVNDKSKSAILHVSFGASPFLNIKRPPCGKSRSIVIVGGEKNVAHFSQCVISVHHRISDFPDREARGRMRHNVFRLANCEKIEATLTNGSTTMHHGFKIR